MISPLIWRQRPDRVAFHSQSAEPWRITCVDTGEDAMTGARLWRARKYLEPDGIFCATYGDGVADIDIPALIQFHKSHGKIATLTGAHPPGRFGELALKGTMSLNSTKSRSSAAAI